MGRWCSGDIDHKLWVGIQSSDAADRFGVTGHQPEELYYQFGEEDLPGIYEELSNIKDNLGSNLILLHEFFEEWTKKVSRAWWISDGSYVFW